MGFSLIIVVGFLACDKGFARKCDRVRKTLMRSDRFTFEHKLSAKTPTALSVPSGVTDKTRAITMYRTAQHLSP
jgi:hypothetical protein